MIIDLQRRLAEIGRIRIGQTVPIGKSGKTRPAKLDTFRLTSADRQRIQLAAQLYGGTVTAWDAPAGPQWEVITDTDRLPVLVPPTDMAFSQWYELWSGGGCQRRCDGRFATFNDNGTLTDGECLCDPDQRECDIHSRLSVMLRNLVGLGLWRLDTQGWNAALELQGAVEVMQLAAGRGQMLPAQLRLEQRMVKRPGQQTRRFAVPVLDIEISPDQLLGGTTEPPAIEPHKPVPDLIERAAPNGVGSFQPVPDTVPEWPRPSIAEQANFDPPARRSKAQPVPATGLLPRTAAQLGEGLTADKRGEGPAEHGTPPPSPSPPVEPPPDDEDQRPITAPQLKKLQTLLGKAGFASNDREGKHDFVAAAIGHPIESAKELTLDEASRVIDILENPRETA